jgi:hypothetical protein
MPPYDLSIMSGQGQVDLLRFATRHFAAQTNGGS